VKKRNGLPLGLVAEFASPEQLLQAIARMRDRGYRQLDAFVPYPVKGLEAALDLRRSGLNWLAFLAGLFGAIFAFWLQWLVNHRLYPLNIGGRPSFAIPVFIIIAFETMVLFAGVTSFASLFWVCRLPRLAHPLFAVEGFETASFDGFWLGVNADDPAFDPEATEAQLTELGASRVAMARGLA
jgi:ActD protein